VPAPVNLAPNSQWEIFSAVLYDTRMNVEGTGTLGPVSLVSHTTGSNEVTLSVSGDISQWKTGDLIKVSGAGVSIALTTYPLRIQNIGSSTLDVVCPLGLIPSSSSSGTILPVNIGCAASLGSGDAADGWKKGTSVYAWREDNAENVMAGAIHSLGCRLTTASADEPLYILLDATRYRGQRVCFGVYVYQKVKGGVGTWRPFFNTGTISYGSVVTGTGFVWAEYSITVPINADILYAGIRFNGASGDTYYVCNPVFTVGSSIGSGMYTKPQETFLPVVHLSPWINASITFPSSAVGGLYYWPFDLYADTGGAVARTVPRAEGCNEGINDNALVTSGDQRRLIGFADRATGPIKLGPFMPHIAAGAKSYASADIPLIDGSAVVFSGFSGDSWSNIALDLDKFYLQ
jgi:hypothetical protein